MSLNQRFLKLRFLKRHRLAWIFALLLAQGLAASAPGADEPSAGKAFRSGRPVKRAGWKEALSRSGGFRIWLPGDPDVTKKQIPTPLGDIATTSYQLRHGELSYNVAFSEYPKAPPDAAKFLEGVRDGIVKGSGGKLVSEKEISLGEGPSGSILGRELEIELTAEGQPLTLAVRIYLSGRRLYQLQAAGASASYPEDVVADFMGSFQLMPAATAAKRR